MMPCYTDDALVCSRSIVRDLLHQRYFPSDSCWMFKNRSQKCSTSGEWDPYPATQAAKASFTAFLHHFRSQATERTRRRTPWMSELSSRLLKSFTLRESPLSLAKNTKTWSSKDNVSGGAICPQQPNIFLDVETDDDVDQSWKQGSFHWFLPRMPSDQKNGGSTLDAPRFAGRKEWPLKLFSSSLRLFEQKAMLTTLHRNDPPSPWPRPDSAVSKLASPSYTYTVGSCALCNNQILESWMNVACECDASMKHDRDHGDRSRKRARPQWARMPLILNMLKRNLKLLGGFIGNGEPPPPPPLCTRL